MVGAGGLTGEEDGNKGIMTKGGRRQREGGQVRHRDSLAVNRKHLNLGHLDSIATR